MREPCSLAARSPAGAQIPTTRLHSTLVHPNLNPHPYHLTRTHREPEEHLESLALLARPRLNKSNPPCTHHFKSTPNSSNNTHYRYRSYPFDPEPSILNARCSLFRDLPYGRSYPTPYFSSTYDARRHRALVLFALKLRFLDGMDIWMMDRFGWFG
jgi:hypothetical protein